VLEAEPLSKPQGHSAAGRIRYIETIKWPQFKISNMQMFKAKDMRMMMMLMMCVCLCVYSCDNFSRLNGKGIP
jgi:hypothetical protein